ncbi:MAG: hypothetical protein WCD89_10630 [Anaerocolumna sp.]
MKVSKALQIMKGGDEVSCSLAIYDREIEYANQLMEYMKRKQKKLSQIRVFTNSDSLREYAGQNPIQILLINKNISIEETIPIEEMKQDSIKLCNIKHICLLSEDNYTSGNSLYPMIYKFQSAEVVMKELFTYYPLQEIQGSGKNSIERKVEIINVFSIGTDISRQIFSFSLANQYAAFKKTLYINLNIFDTLSGFIGHPTEKGLSDFIYFLKQNNPNIINKMKSTITKINNLDYIKSVSFGPDLYELTTEDIIQWLNEMRMNTDYEVIIFDVGCYFQPILELFRNSSQLMFLVGDNNWEQAKYNVLKEQLNWSGYEDILEKATIVPISEEENLNLHNINLNHFELEIGKYNLAAGYIVS